ncbi:carbohydrate sulfotransferase 4-like isoform X3 [Physella acuta]|uniref:carbohydrate sulfotransferase 4-like isoform X3 n=1 Tax=Physella acuta TaxID=109671 RepID=UPI0027DE8F84|nr:carbohydrate sulfotransferase 4-like isoform X3 [Physella acuta]
MCNLVLNIVSLRFLSWKKQLALLLAAVVYVCLTTLQIHVTFHTRAGNLQALTVSSKHYHVKVSGTTTTTGLYWSNGKETSPRKQQQSAIKVIVLSYMRSGSTLCGDVLQVHPDVFYVYEPLLYLWDHYVPLKRSRDVDIRNRTKKHWRSTKRYIPKPVDFIRYMFTCNLTRYNMDFLTNVAHSEDFRTVGCIRTKRNTNIVNVTDNCVSVIRQRCLNSRAIVQKVVRLTMAEADVYLEQDPAVRIIHLIRDPRGILLSRMHYNSKMSGEMHNNYTFFCQRIREDIRISREITHKHWGKILTVRYEDLAQTPLDLTTTMYNFVGLEMSPSIADYVKTIMSHDLLNKTARKTSRKNPMQTAYRWRQELPFSVVKQIDHECEDVLRSMGYVSFRTEQQLRDLNIPAKVQDYAYGLLTA